MSETFNIEADQFTESWNLSRSNHGSTLTVYSPGMFVYNGIRGKYQAVSITTRNCSLSCEHCKGVLLQSMPELDSPDALLKFALDAWKRGDIGILLTGGCDENGFSPWKRFTSAILEIKKRTGLKVSIHPGQVDKRTALDLKAAGVDQALVDVIGSDKTARDVYHLKGGVDSVVRTMDALTHAEIEIAPHVIMGLHYGEILGEYQALEIIKSYHIKKYVVVVLNPLKQTPMENVVPPPPDEVGRFLVKARREMPQALASLGCARPRGKYRLAVDIIAVKAGVNSIALASDKAVELAQNMGLEVKYESSCCSVS